MESRIADLEHIVRREIKRADDNDRYIEEIRKLACESEKKIAALESWRTQTDAGISEMAGRLRGECQSNSDRIEKFEKELAELKKHQCKCHCK